MHELCEDAAAGRMDRIDGAAPGIRLFPVGQARLTRIGLRIGLVGVDAFAGHQAEAAACEALIVAHHAFARHTSARGADACHRRDRQAVGEIETFEAGTGEDR